MSIDHARIAEELVTGTSALIAKAVAPLVARIEALESQLATKTVAFKGVFSRGVTYDHGDLVTRSGSAWLALRDQPGTPGSDPDGWLMVSKSGTE